MQLRRTVFPASGVNAADGSYVRPALPARAVAALARRAVVDHGYYREIAAEVTRRLEGTREPVDGRSPLDLAEAGWGIVFGENADPAIQEALADLRELRRRQAGDLYAEFREETGFRAGESKLEFLRRAETAPGAVDPLRVPYYLLLVGGPGEIPFRIQYQLGLRHAVGRLDFERPEDYFHYARSAIRSERRARSIAANDLVLFAPANEGDALTAASNEVLAGEMSRQMEPGSHAGWTVRAVRGGEATKDQLVALLRGRERPDVLLSATHGVTYPDGHPHRRSRQGALLCQNWPGPDHLGPTLSDWFLAAEDIEDGTDLTGMVIFNFACYSAGTHADPPQFTAALAQRMLSLPEGGAAAVVGHVDEAWLHSFLWAGLRWPQAYEQSLKRLLRGDPLGWSMEPFSRRYAELAADLYDLRENAALGLAADTTDQQLAELWTATVDARGFIVLGDPAVRLSRLEVAS